MGRAGKARSACPPNTCWRARFALPALHKQIVMLRDGVPSRTGIEARTGAGDHAGAVHQPDRGRAVIVLPENVARAVPLLVPGADPVPAPPLLLAHIVP